jgi:imidazolonepropionase-like amidohydrolase
MANNSTGSAKTKVIHAGFLLTDPDIEPKSEQSILIEGERIKAVSAGFIDPPLGGELIDLRKKFVLLGLIDRHVHLTSQLDRGSRLRTVEDSDAKVGFDAAHHAAVTLAAGFTTVRDVGATVIPILFSHCGPPSPRKGGGTSDSLRLRMGVRSARPAPLSVDIDEIELPRSFEGPQPRATRPCFARLRPSRVQGPCALSMTKI